MPTTVMRNKERVKELSGSRAASMLWSQGSFQPKGQSVFCGVGTFWVLEWLFFYEILVTDDRLFFIFKLWATQLFNIVGSSNSNICKVEERTVP